MTHSSQGTRARFSGNAQRKALCTGDRAARLRGRVQPRMLQHHLRPHARAPARRRRASARPRRPRPRRRPPRCGRTPPAAPGGPARPQTPTAAPARCAHALDDRLTATSVRGAPSLSLPGPIGQPPLGTPHSPANVSYPAVLKLRWVRTRRALQSGSQTRARPGCRRARGSAPCRGRARRPRPPCAPAAPPAPPSSLSQLTTSVSCGLIRPLSGFRHSVSTSAYTPPTRSTARNLRAAAPRSAEQARAASPRRPRRQPPSRGLCGQAAGPLPAAGGQSVSRASRLCGGPRLLHRGSLRLRVGSGLGQTTSQVQRVTRYQASPGEQQARAQIAAPGHCRHCRRRAPQAGHPARRRARRA